MRNQEVVVPFVPLLNSVRLPPLLIFFFTDSATTGIYTLSLHDALPIWASRPAWRPPRGRSGRRRSAPGRTSFCPRDRKSTRLNSSHITISYAVFCLKKKILNNPYVFIPLWLLLSSFRRLSFSI